MQDVPWISCLYSWCCSWITRRPKHWPSSKEYAYLAQCLQVWMLVGKSLLNKPWICSLGLTIESVKGHRLSRQPAWKKCGEEFSSHQYSLIISPWNRRTKAPVEVWAGTFLEHSELIISQEQETPLHKRAPLCSTRAESVSAMNETGCLRQSTASQFRNSFFLLLRALRVGDLSILFFYAAETRQLY